MVLEKGTKKLGDMQTFYKVRTLGNLTKVLNLRKVCNRLADIFLFVTLPIFRYFSYAMKFFPSISARLKPLWQYSVQKTLWRVVFSHNGYIVCEERDTDNKSVSFSCIQSSTGKAVWRHRSFNEQWWIGIEGITNDRLYLHGFKKPDMPEHLGIIAVDLLTGEELWRSMNASFLTDDNVFVYGFKDLFERRVYYKINRQSGTFIEQLEFSPAGIDPHPQLEKTDFLFPLPYHNNDHSVAEALTLLHIDREQVKAVEYVHCGLFLILTTYTKREADSMMKNSLSIIDTRAEKKVYSDVLNEATPYPVPDSFFVDGDTLYYVKERKTFVALLLK